MKRHRSRPPSARAGPSLHSTSILTLALSGGGAVLSLHHLGVRLPPGNKPEGSNDPPTPREFGYFDFYFFFFFLVLELRYFARPARSPPGCTIVAGLSLSSFCLSFGSSIRMSQVGEPGCILSC